MKRNYFGILAAILVTGLVAGCDAQGKNNHIEPEGHPSSKVPSLKGQQGVDSKSAAQVAAGLLPAANAPDAPEFALKNMDGEEVKLSSLRGKVVVLYFWDKWSPPYKQEIHEFIELQTQYKN